MGTPGRADVVIQEDSSQEMSISEHFKRPLPLAVLIVLPLFGSCTSDDTTDVPEFGRAAMSTHNLGITLDKIEAALKSVVQEFEIRQVGRIGDSIMYAGLFDRTDLSLALLTDDRDSIFRCVLYVGYSHPKHWDVVDNVVASIEPAYSGAVLCAVFKAGNVWDRREGNHRVIIARDSTGYLVRAEMQPDSIVIPGVAPSIYETHCLTNPMSVDSHGTVR